MADSMEKLLLGDDDSSSGESDTEVAISNPPPAPAPAATVAPPPKVADPSNMSQSELSARLKSMYSPASKTSQPVSTQPAMPQVSQQPQRPNVPSQQHHSSMAQMQPRPSQPSIPPQPIHHQRPPASQPVPQQVHRMAPPPQQPPPRSVMPLPPVSRGQSTDPFEPTPVSKILEKQQQKVRAMAVATGSAVSAPAHRYMPPQPSAPMSTVAPPGATPTTNAVPSTMTSSAPPGTMRPTERPGGDPEDVKKQKEQFLIFTRVLMKYLEQKDPALHRQVKEIIRDCAERNRRHEKGYESVTNSMRQRLRQVVNESYWTRAEQYMKHFLANKAKSARAGAQVAAPSGTAKVETSQTGPMTTTASVPQPSKPADLDAMRKAQQARAATAAAVAPARNPPPPMPVAKARMPAVPTPTPAAKYQPNKQVVQPVVAAKGKSPSAKPRKPSLTPTNTTAARKAPETTPVPPTTPTATPSTPKEYKDFMEAIDHAWNYDWTNAGYILGQKPHLQLNEEQFRLLYNIPTKKVPNTLDQHAFPRAGWDKRNVVSARCAWARIRLREQPKPGTNTNPNPAVAGGLLSMPSPANTSAHEDPSRGSSAVSSATAWFNEDFAEDDKALAALSEGMQIYLKSVLEKAIHCARQRQNVDGIRLWHQQSLPSGSRPPLGIRLGCDVTRQVAQAEGNAAMVCKRMEEALHRQSRVPERDRVVNEETLVRVQNLSEAALLPRLSKAAEEADAHAKRSFEVYGGRDASEPPLGRIPKKARLELIDFQMGMNFCDPQPFHACPTSSAFYF